MNLLLIVIILLMASSFYIFMNHSELVKKTISEGGYKLYNKKNKDYEKIFKLNKIEENIEENISEVFDKMVN